MMLRLVSLSSGTDAMLRLVPDDPLIKPGARLTFKGQETKWTVLRLSEKMAMQETEEVWPVHQPIQIDHYKERE